MKYYKPPEYERRTTDQQAKAASRQRMRRRGWGKLGWWVGILALLAAVYFTFGGKLLAGWLGGQAAAVKGEARGIKGTGEIFTGRTAGINQTSGEEENPAPPAGR